MKKPPLIVAKNISLKAPVVRPEDRKVLNNPVRFLSDLYFSRTKRGMITMLDNVSFDLDHGMKLGIMGPNGAGKSSLLRVLAGIYTPTAGQLTIHGTTKGLFDVTMGMNMEATGLENIYMRGLQMDLELNEIKALVPEVISFSELDDWIDQPFMTYSTGMRLRLAVAISTMIEPDILLLDEWIGTGDARFHDKVQKRMNQLVENSHGLVIASHNKNLLKDLCSHALYLADGKVVFIDEIDAALKRASKIE